jgi:hypothetical protein
MKGESRFTKQERPPQRTVSLAAQSEGVRLGLGSLFLAALSVSPLMRLRRSELSAFARGFHVGHRRYRPYLLPSRLSGQS